MFRPWHVALLVAVFGTGCTEMDTGNQDLDTITQPRQEESNEPTSDDSAYDDAKTELTEAADAVQDLADEQKDKFIQEIDEQLKELDTSIAEMEEQAKEMKEDARKEIEQQLADINTKRQALLDRLEEVGKASGNAWEDFKEGVINAWDELRKARDDASSGVEVKVGDGVDVQVGDGLTIDVGEDGTNVEVSPPDTKDE